MKLSAIKEKNSRLIVKKCHLCGSVMEGHSEHKRCSGCRKAFLPVNYFGKVHAKNSKEFEKLFAASDELHEEDLIKGLTVLW
jgi:hypothetical protein